MLLLFELSGEHPTLPCAELECVGRVVHCLPQVAVAECEFPDKTRRLALTHTVMEYLGETEASKDAIVAFLTRRPIIASGTFSVRVKKVQGGPATLSQLDLERTIGSLIEGEVSLDHPDVEFRVLLSGERCSLGRVLHSIDRGGFEYRNPLRRPFFHPGVMLPRTARAMVNLSLVQERERILDPFCGTGGILMEAQIIGAEMIAGDADEIMVRGCRQNIPHADAVIENATHLPFQDGCVHAVVTDLPYGQSVGIHAATLPRLYMGALNEIHRVLQPGRRAVVVTHQDIRTLLKTFYLVQYHEQRVHRSLTRRIMVLEKKREL